MTFNYGYRDSSNARLTGVIVASSRDDAYRQLKEKGVRPTFVTLAPGLKNRLLSLGKRGWTIIALGILLVTVFVTLLAQIKQSNNQTIQQSSAPLTRRQIYGDPALMEKLQLENYASLFEEEGDRVLAHFAQPALIDRYVASLKKDPKSRAKAAEALAALVDANFCSRQGQASRQKTKDKGEASPSHVSSLLSSASVFCRQSSVLPQLPSPGKDSRQKTKDVASRETSELLRIVRWLRSEFSAYLAAGTGTPETYLARLLERQTYEAQFYARAKRELEGVTDPAVYEKRNDELRAIGAPTIPLPLAEEE